MAEILVSSDLQSSVAALLVGGKVARTVTAELEVSRPSERHLEVSTRLRQRGVQARSQGFELGGSDFGHTQNHTQYHTPLIVCFDFILDDKELMEESVMSDDYVELLVSIL